MRRRPTDGCRQDPEHERHEQVGRRAAIAATSADLRASPSHRTSRAMLNNRSGANIVTRPVARARRLRRGISIRFLSVDPRRQEV